MDELNNQIQHLESKSTKLESIQQAIENVTTADTTTAMKLIDDIQQDIVYF